MHATLDSGTDTLAYTHCHGSHPDGPGLVFLPGFRSHRAGDKARYLLALAEARGWSFTAVDYRGHGESSGDFELLGISDWTDDASAVICAVTRGPQVLIGSSMGAWIAVRVALAHPQRVQALVTVAAAPDFTEDLLWPTLDAKERDTLALSGRVLRPSDYGDGPYPLSQALFDRSRDACVLRAAIPLHCPLRALHGGQDPDVPITQSEALLNAWSGADKTLTRVPDGDHRLSRPADLDVLRDTLDALISGDKRSANTD